MGRKRKLLLVFSDPERSEGATDAERSEAGRRRTDPIATDLVHGHLFSMKKKKILFLITKSNWGGAQRYVYDLATHLSTQYDVVVALGGEGTLYEKLQAAGVRTISLHTLQRDISLRKEIGFIRELWNLLRSEQPDILHVNSSKAGGMGAFLGRLLRVPRVVFTAHGWTFNEDRPWWQRRVIAFFHWLTVMFAHRTIAVSKAIKAQLRWPYAGEKMTVIFNGRESVSTYDRTDARMRCIERCPALETHAYDLWTGTIAELHPVKQHDVAIDAIARCVAEGIPMRHIVIGAGQERERLAALIEHKNLSEHVFLLGHIDDAARLLSAFDIFILPSRSEALAYTIIEAAQTGLPIIASEVGGIPEIITHEQDGLLVPSGDAEQLADAIAHLTTDDAFRMRLASAAHTRGQYFSLPRMVSETQRIYETTQD